MFIFLAQDCENALFSDCSEASKRFRKPQFARSAFKMQFEDSILKEVPTKARQTSGNCCENMFFASRANFLPLRGAQEEDTE